MSAHSSSPLKLYFGIWATLLACTGLTVWAAFLDLGRFNAAVALTIATLKATLVALFFMHLKDASDRFVKVAVVASIFFLFILLALSMTDYVSRTWN
jgi:cytochrome c oxidase subunit 4